MWEVPCRGMLWELYLWMPLGVLYLAALEQHRALGWGKGGATQLCRSEGEEILHPQNVCTGGSFQPVAVLAERMLVCRGRVELVWLLHGSTEQVVGPAWFLGLCHKPQAKSVWSPSRRRLSDSQKAFKQPFPCGHPARESSVRCALSGRGSGRCFEPDSEKNLVPSGSLPCTGSCCPCCVPDPQQRVMCAAWC